MHSKDIIHRDIKLTNILMGENENTLEIADFGFSGKGETRIQFGTPVYMAPEIVKKELCGKPVDIWAMGCILYEIFTGNTLPLDKNSITQYSHLATCSNQTDINTHLDDISQYATNKGILHYFDNEKKTNSLIY